jgi:3-hydroxybutyryl-CoA dehydrogenase
MGTGLAYLFTRHGLDVILSSHSGRMNTEGFADIVHREQARGRLKSEDVKGIMERVVWVRDLEDSAVGSVDLACECVREDWDTKVEALRAMEAACGASVITATVTSSLSVEGLSRQLRSPTRFVGLHFFNPPYLMELVEVIFTGTTDPDVTEKVDDLLHQTGKTAIHVADTPGFVVNRVLMSMINEAAYLFWEGTASREDIDLALCLGARHPMGPLKLADFIGLDVCFAALSAMKSQRDAEREICPIFEQLVQQGRVGRKSGRGFYDYEAQ